MFNERDSLTSCQKITCSLGAYLRPRLLGGQVIPKTEKMVHDAALFSTQHYKVRIKGKVLQSKECSSALPNTSVL